MVNSKRLSEAQLTDDGSEPSCTCENFDTEKAAYLFALTFALYTLEKC